MPLVARAVILGAATATASPAPDRIPAGAVLLSPADDFNGVINGAPAGAVFGLEDGVYRRFAVVVKSGQQFIGRTIGGAILNGAMIVTGWTDQGDGTWRAAVPAPLASGGQGSSTATGMADELFVDGVRRQRVLTLGALVGGQTWYRTTAAPHFAYLKENPAGRAIELAQDRHAFRIGANGINNVLIDGMIVRYYASAAQQGAIEPRGPNKNDNGDFGSNWTLRNLTVHWNHARGVSLSHGLLCEDSRLNDNGQMGVGGGAGGWTFRRVEFARNNFAGFGTGWEAGGLKYASGSLFSNNLIEFCDCHHNDGRGFWGDYGGQATTIRYNKIWANEELGIALEACHTQTVERNYLHGNGTDGYAIGVWRSQVLLQNTNDSVVRNNTLYVDRDNAEGIGVINAERGSDQFGRLAALNNTIRDNEIVTDQSGSLTARAPAIESTTTQAEGNNVHATLTASGQKWHVPVGSSGTLRCTGYVNGSQNRTVASASATWGWSAILTEHPNPAALVPDPATVDVSLLPTIAGNMVAG
jgi:hypothetical protein